MIFKLKVVTSKHGAHELCYPVNISLPRRQLTPLRAFYEKEL